MKLVKFIEFLRNHLKTLVRLCFMALALVVLLDAIRIASIAALCERGAILLNAAECR